MKKKHTWTPNDVEKYWTDIWANYVIYEAHKELLKIIGNKKRNTK